MFEIWVPFICLKPEIPISLITHVLRHEPRHEWYHKNRESHTDLLHQHIAFTYLLQPTTTIPALQRTWKEFLPSLDQGRIEIKREQQTRLTRTRAMALSTCELWQTVWCSLTFSDLWSHHCEGSKKNYRHSFSDLQGLQQNFLSNHVVWSHRSGDEVPRPA